MAFHLLAVQLVRLLTVVSAAKPRPNRQNLTPYFSVVRLYFLFIVISPPICSQGVGGSGGVTKRGLTWPTFTLFSLMIRLSTVTLVAVQSNRLNGLVTVVRTVAVTRYMRVAGLTTAVHLFLLRYR